MEVATHGDIVCLDLRDDVLSEAARAKTDPVAEVTDPTPIVFAHFKVVVVAEAQACVTELTIAPVLGLLSKCQVPPQVDVRVLLHIYLQQFWDEGLKASLVVFILSTCLTLHLLADQVSQR